MASKITATVTGLGYDRDEDGWEHNAYRVTLHYQGRRMTLPYKTGMAWEREPNAADIMECILSDASSADEDFDEWCASYGYNTEMTEDYKQAKKTYNAVQRQTDKLRRLLGDDFDRYVYPDGNLDSEAFIASITA